MCTALIPVGTLHGAKAEGQDLLLGWGARLPSRQSQQRHQVGLQSFVCVAHGTGVLFLSLITSHINVPLEGREREMGGETSKECRWRPTQSRLTCVRKCEIMWKRPTRARVNTQGAVFVLLLSELQPFESFTDSVDVLLWAFGTSIFLS